MPGFSVKGELDSEQGECDGKGRDEYAEPGPRRRSIILEKFEHEQLSQYGPYLRELELALRDELGPVSPFKFG